MIKYIKSVLWRAAKRLSYIEDARCLKVKGCFATVRGSMRMGMCTVFGRHKKATLGVTAVAITAPKLNNNYMEQPPLIC